MNKWGISPQHLQEEQETAREITASGEFEEHLTFEDQGRVILQFLHADTGLEIWRDDCAWVTPNGWRFWTLRKAVDWLRQCIRQATAALS
jgi:hypothetical protein